MKLTNTWKHAAIGALCGLLWFLMCLIPGMGQMECFGMIAFFLLTVAWENAQRLRAKRWDWIDSAVDVIAGNAGFHIVYWLLV